MIDKRTARHAAVPTSTSRGISGPPTGRFARTLLATVPIVLVGSLAMSLLTPTAAEASTAKRPLKHKSTIDAKKLISRPGSPLVAKNTVVPSSYRVVDGDTVTSVAGRFGLSTASVLALNGLGWKSLIFPGQILKLSKATASAVATTTHVSKYTIEKGDTVASVAARFGVSTRSVLVANGLTASSIIFAGHKITIPTTNQTDAATINARPASSVTAIGSSTAATKTSYVLATGDTITSVAKKFSVPVESILAANDLTASSLIYAGRTLTIPSLAVYVPGRGVVTLLTDEMERNARTIIATGKSLGVSDRGIVVALAAAMQESSLRNVSYGHLDSIGLFQQRPSIGWGSQGQLLDPEYAARLFYGGPSNPRAGVTRGLLDVPGWESLTITQAAQAVQVSAHPDAYAQWEQSARFWLDELD